MIRTTGLKTKFIQKEAENSDLEVYIIRWAYRPIMDKVNPDQEDSEEVESDYASWTYERFYHEPTLQEIKSTILDWCNNYYEKNGFYIDNKQCKLSEADRSTLKIQCEHNSESTVLIPCFNGAIELDSDTALQVLLRLNDYYEACKKIKENLESKIKGAESLEAINELDFFPTFPEDVKLNTSDLSDTVTKIQKENAINKQAVSFSKLIINTVELTDEQSLGVKYLYPDWESFIGKSLDVGMKVLYDDKLYKVIQAVNPVLENHPPSINRAALYTEINETHAGTKEDPIPYNNNMELELGKYYTQDGVLYMCHRDSEQPVYNNLADLVGIYVTLVEE